MLRNPALIIALRCHRSSGHSRSISPRSRNLLLRVNRLLRNRTLATLAAALQLWEERLDPGLVDKVESSQEASEEEEVKEDAGSN